MYFETEWQQLDKSQVREEDISKADKNINFVLLTLRTPVGSERIQQVFKGYNELSIIGVPCPKVNLSGEINVKSAMLKLIDPQRCH